MECSPTGLLKLLYCSLGLEGEVRKLVSQGVVAAHWRGAAEDGAPVTGRLGQDLRDLSAEGGLVPSGQLVLTAGAKQGTAQRPSSQSL